MMQIKDFVVDRESKPWQKSNANLAVYIKFR